MPDIIDIPFPDLGGMCFKIFAANGEICIPFPGGTMVCAQVGYDLGDPTEIIKSLFAQVNSALAPLGPFFNVLDVLAKIFQCIKAIPDCLGPPPSPQPIIKCLSELAKAVAAIIKLIPPLSIPPMIKQILTAIIAFLTGLEDNIRAFAAKAAQILAAQTKAAQLGNIQFSAGIDCAKSNFDIQLANMNAGLAPLNRLLGVVNFFMQLAQLGCIPTLGDIGPIDEALKPIDVIIGVLTSIRDAIPDLDFNIQGGGSDC